MDSFRDYETFKNQEGFTAYLIPFILLLSERFLKTEPKKTLSYKPKKQSPLTLSTESNLRLQLLWWPTSSVVLVSLQRQGLTPLSGPTPVITQVSRHTQFYEQSKKHSLQWKNSSHRFQRLPVSSFQVAESAALGNEGRRLSSMKDYRFNVSKDCRQQPKPMHLRGQSMASMWMSGDVSAWKLGVPPTMPRMPRKNKGVHYSSSTLNSQDGGKKRQAQGPHLTLTSQAFVTRETSIYTGEKEMGERKREDSYSFR